MNNITDLRINNEKMPNPIIDKFNKTTNTIKSFCKDARNKFKSDLIDSRLNKEKGNAVLKVNNELQKELVSKRQMLRDLTQDNEFVKSLIGTLIKYDVIIMKKNVNIEKFISTQSGTLIIYYYGEWFSTYSVNKLFQTISDLNMVDKLHVTWLATPVANTTKFSLYTNGSLEIDDLNRNHIINIKYLSELFNDYTSMYIGLTSII